MKLVVDLDGTLIRTDMLIETLWSAISRDWKCIFRVFGLLLSGRAPLKRYLASTANIDESILPYDSDIVDYIRNRREQGDSTALVTASDQGIADRIASHLKLFDEVHGSDGVVNLKGKAKAKFLEEQFGIGEFAYMGDSSADVHVWRKSGKAITVNATRSLKSKVEQLGKPIEHITTANRSLYQFFRALRPYQWLKNILVFIPIIASQQINYTTLLHGIAAFAAFSLVASSVYVLNDMLDLTADRSHPRKRERPFASGRISIVHGSWMVFCPVFLGLVLAFQLGWNFFIAMLFYIVLTSAYSLQLKRFYVIDICLLALLYTFRIVAGGLAVGISLSVWLLAFSLFFFFSLAAVKRQAELVDLAKRKQLSVTGRGYHVDDLPIISMIAIGSGYVSVLVMALYINSSEVQEVYHQPAALWGICCILLYWITHIVMETHRGFMHDDPLIYAVKDRISIVCGIFMLICLVSGTIL